PDGGAAAVRARGPRAERAARLAGGPGRGAGGARGRARRGERRGGARGRGAHPMIERLAVGAYRGAMTAATAAAGLASRLPGAPAPALRGAAVRRLYAPAHRPRARAPEPGGAPRAPPAPRRARHGAPAPGTLPARGVPLHRDRDLADAACRARRAGRADLHGERAPGARADAARALAPP